MTTTPVSSAEILSIIHTRITELLDRLENERAGARPRTEAEAEARAMTHDTAAADLQRALKCNDHAPVSAITEELRSRYPNSRPGEPKSSTSRVI